MITKLNELIELKRAELGILAIDYDDYKVAISEIFMLMILEPYNNNTLGSKSISVYEDFYRAKFYTEEIEKYIDDIELPEFEIYSMDKLPAFDDHRDEHTETIDGYVDSIEKSLGRPEFFNKFNKLCGGYADNYEIKDILVDYIICKLYIADDEV